MEKENLLLSTNRISIGYHHKKDNITIADNISLNLRKGRLIALLGANGIGKSTLLRTLTGIQKPLTGSVILDGEQIQSYNPKEMAQILSVVLTESLPPSNLTVYELIALGRQPYTNWLGKLSETDKKAVDKALQQTQLTHLTDRKHYEISDGQLQKVLVARALAQDTPIIILDEPTTHLDLLHKVSLLKLLKQLTENTDKCILYSTHDLELALQLCDEIIVMTDKGTVQGTPKQLIENNTFDKLFKDDAVAFDKTKNGFIIR